MLLSSAAPEIHSRLAGIALAFFLCAGAPPAGAADPAAPGSEEHSQEAERASESASGESAGEPADEAAAEGELRTAPSQGIEEIVITGEILSGTPDGAPVSDVQFDPEELRAIGAEDVSDLARFTPSLEINTVSATSPTFFVRGVGLNDFNANAPGAVAIYRDGVPINAPAIQLGSLFDVENVEILRGPQGFGDDRNASGGAIKTYSRKPDGNVDAYLTADYGNYNYQDFQGALGVPLMEDLLSSRIAFRFTQRDPFTRNGCGDQQDAGGQRVCGESVTTVIPPGLPTRVNDLWNWAGRGQLRFQPPGIPLSESHLEMDWLLNVHGGRVDHFSPLGQVIGTANPRGNTAAGYIDPAVNQLWQEKRDALVAEGVPAGQAREMAKEQTLAQVVKDIGKARPFRNDYNLVGEESQDTVGGFLRGDLALGPVRMYTITGTEWYDRSRLTDFDFSPNTAIHIDQKDHGQQWTENLGFEWEAPDRPLMLRWGGYYLGEEVDATGIFELSPAGGFINLVDQAWKQSIDSFGIYANFTWDFLEDFTLEGGARFNWEQKTFDLQVDTTLIVPPFNIPVFLPGDPTREARTWSAPTGGISLTYRLTEELSAYWKYTRGWKGGHFNANVITVRLAGENLVTATPSVADPETIDAFETGLSGNWLDGRLALNANFFYYQYQDYQVFVIQNQTGAAPQIQVINANNARVYGIEADFQAEPLTGWAPELLEGLVLAGRFGWLESEFLDFTDTRFDFIPGTTILESVVVDYTGNRLPNTPRFKVSATAEYPFDLGNWGTLIPRYDLTWTDDNFFDPSEGRGAADFFDRGRLPEYSVGQRAYALHDLRLTYRPPLESVEISGWVRNLTDEVYKTLAADLTVANASLLNWIGAPRTYGLSVAVSF